MKLPQVVWTSNSYDPLDLRSTLPVARKKFVLSYPKGKIFYILCLIKFDSVYKI